MTTTTVQRASIIDRFVGPGNTAESILTEVISTRFSNQQRAANGHPEMVFVSRTYSSLDSKQKRAVKQYLKMSFKEHREECKLLKLTFIDGTKPGIEPDAPDEAVTLMMVRAKVWMRLLNEMTR